MEFELSDVFYPVCVMVLFWMFYAFGVRERIIGLPRVQACDETTEDIIPTRKKVKNGEKKSQSKVKRPKEEKQTATHFTHPWLAGTLKGHTSHVHNLQMSPNGSVLASCGSDRTVRLWLTKDFLERDHKQIRVNVEFDYASLVHWSPDNKAFLIAKSEEKSLEVYKLGKKPDGSIGNITKASLRYAPAHQEEIVGIGLSCNGKFMMTCSISSHLVIWDLRGNVIDEMSIADGITYAAKVSQCGRYIGVCGHYEQKSSNLVLREVNFKEEKYVGVVLAFSGGANKIAVYSFDFNNDSSKIVTLDVKGVWKLFDTTGNRLDITWTGTFRTDFPNMNCENRPVVRLSHDGRVVIVAAKANIEIYSGLTGSFLLRIEDIHSEPIKDVQFSIDDIYFITCGDRIVKVFNNISGYQETIQDLRNQMNDKSLSQALRNRISKQLVSLEIRLSVLTL